MENIQCGKELNQFRPPNSNGDLCLLFCFYPSSMWQEIQRGIMYLYLHYNIHGSFGEGRAKSINCWGFKVDQLVTNISCILVRYTIHYTVYSIYLQCMYTEHCCMLLIDWRFQCNLILILGKDDLKILFLNFKFKQVNTLVTLLT